MILILRVRLICVLTSPVEILPRALEMGLYRVIYLLGHFRSRFMVAERQGG